ncbi:MAG: DNRLRE domain-containing protein [Chloroflexota bacterium]|nr:DNRLRE domain-containing protein [Chloroflexota bacterium]
MNEKLKHFIIVAFLWFVLLLGAVVTLGRPVAWAGSAVGEPEPVPAYLPMASGMAATVESNPPSPGVYTFLDYRNVDPNQYPFVIGGHQVFQWNLIENYTQGSFDWSEVDEWITEEAQLGKPVIIGFNAFDGRCCGGDWLPYWFRQQHPVGDGFVSCWDSDYNQYIDIPRYWGQSYQNAWRDFVQAAAARYDNDQRVVAVEISHGMYGETIPSDSPHDICLYDNGLTSELWIETVNDITDVYADAWQSKPLFIQYAPFYLDRIERREFAQYAGNLGIGMKHNKLLVDHDDQVIHAPGNTYIHQTGQYDPMFLYGNDVPTAWEAYRNWFPGETDTYWAFLNGLNKNPNYILANFSLISTVTALEEEMMHFANLHMGRTILDTPSVWIAMRESEEDWYPQRGNFDHWLYQDDNVPGGRTVPEWNAGSAPQGRYTRRTDQATGNPYMSFNIDDGYILGGTNVVSVTVTYRDSGHDRWWLEYDAVDNPYKRAFEVQKNNTNQWLTVEVALSDAHFGNRQEGGSSAPGQDFRISSNNDGDEFIHFVHVTRLGSGQEIGVTLQHDGTSYAGTTDTYLSAWQPTANYGSQSLMQVRSVDQMASLLKFDLSGLDLPDNAVVTEAYLDLFVNSRSNSNWMDTDVYALRRSWQEYQATWNQARNNVPWSQPGANGEGSDHSTVLLHSERLDEIDVWERFDVTDAVFEWVSGEQPNHGLVFKDSNSSGNVAYKISTREEPDISIRPRLVFTYFTAVIPPTPTPTPVLPPTDTPTPTPTHTPGPEPTPTPTPTPVGPPREVMAGRMGQVLVIDGNLDEWALNSGVLLDRNTADFVHERLNPLPADSSARVWVAWHPDWLYLAARVWDDVLVADSTSIWRDDGIEFGIDGANDENFTGPDDHQITAALYDRVTDWGVIPLDEAQRAHRILSDGFVIEMAVPLSVLQPPVWTAGHQAGFTIGLHDDDDGGDWDSYMVWEGQYTVQSPEDFGTLVLLEEGAPPCYFADVHPNADHSAPASCDGDVDIADVQRVSGCWNSPVNAACPATLDFDGSTVIDLADIASVGVHWGWQQ